MQDISTFDFEPLWDLSLVAPQVVITNKSIGSNIAGCTFWFEVVTGSGLIFHTGTESAPDKTGAWTIFTPAENIPLMQGHVEWSGSYFIVRGYVKNSANEKAVVEKSIRICRPVGNKSSTANNYGAASLFVENLCSRARVSVQDNTNYSYNGNNGIQESKTIKLFYPADGTGVPPTPVSVANVNNALFPVTQNGEGYQVALDAVYRYDFADGSSLRLKYKGKETFAVTCNIDLCPLIYEIDKLERQYQSNGCSAQERENMLLINSKLSRAIMGIMQPLCGVDVGVIIEEIQVLGGFTCSCQGNEGALLAQGLNALTAMGCPETIACINTELNNSSFYSLVADQAAWEALSLSAKLSKIMQNVTDALNGGPACVKPGVITAIVTGTNVALTWPAPVVAVPRYKWVLYAKSDADHGIVSKAGILSTGNALSILALASGSYTLELVAECSDNHFSNISKVDFIII